ncbi:hypothetical protein [Acanthopleuribacter pedis]|uniref:Uncharacterized protein n=1 Tax=Acanthopleuribacter pedis TaxID=442870 RepID=A0A8J7U4B0_9BACT|nr:hypothetical protein [Acanthopleuribacter pedis]MBO1319619.1 hypothetical protein [Acanthopleuribacter pedis]
MTVYGHNEDRWANVVGTLPASQSYRDNLVERLQLIPSHGAALNWQSDHVVLEAILDFENQVDQSNTNDKNIVRYLVEDLGFSVDPHAHTSYCADVAEIMGPLGITPSNVLGGVRHVACGGDYLGFLSLLDWHREAGINGAGDVPGRDFP